MRRVCICVWVCIFATLVEAARPKNKMPNKMNQALFQGVRQAGFNLPMQKQLFEMEKEAMKQKEAIKQKKAIKQNVSGKRQQNSQRKHGKNKSRLH